MRKLLLVISLFVLTFSSAGQGLKDKQLFLSMTVGGGNYFGGGTALNYTGQNGFILNIGLYGFTRTAKNTPDDYHGSFIILMADTPMESAGVVCFASGKSWYLNNKTFRFNLTAGLCIGHRSYPTNFIKKDDQYAGLFVSNYTYDRERAKIYPFIQRSQIEADVARVFGLSLGYTLMLARETTAFSIDFSILLGRIRNKKEKR